jgi:endonuclease-8
MPEGPSIVIMKEALLVFKNKKVIKASGNAKIDFSKIQGRKILDMKSWGKHFLIIFDSFFLRIHLLMFGKYLINETKEMAPRMCLKFKSGEFNFYSCSIKLLEGHPDGIYDWESDTMSDQWNPKKAYTSLKAVKNQMICDGLMEQEIFAGVGNIIKNEALFITKVHPEAKIKNIPVKKLKEVITVAREYCFDFYKWKKAFELKKHYLIYNKSVCPLCSIKVVRKHTGEKDRRSFFCTSCQILYKR